MFFFSSYFIVYPLNRTNLPISTIPNDELVYIFRNISYRKDNATFRLLENTAVVPDCTVLFVIGTLFLAVGVFGNFVTGTLILTIKTLHTPTFTTIACLAVSDLLSSLSRYLLILTQRQKMLKNDETEECYEIFETVALFCLHSSNFHMDLTSYIRYVFVARPIVSLEITCRKVLNISAFIWLSSFVISVIYTMRQCYRRTIVISWWICG